MNSFRKSKFLYEIVKFFCVAFVLGISYDIHLIICILFCEVRKCFNCFIYSFHLSKSSQEYYFFFLRLPIYSFYWCEVSCIFNDMDILKTKFSFELSRCWVWNRDSWKLLIERKSPKHKRFKNLVDRKSKSPLILMISDMVDKKVYGNTLFIKRWEQGDPSGFVDNDINALSFYKFFVPHPSKKIDRMNRVFSDNSYTIYNFSLSWSYKTTSKPSDFISIKYQSLCILKNHSFSSSCSRMLYVFPSEK